MTGRRDFGQRGPDLPAARREPVVRSAGENSATPRLSATRRSRGPLLGLMAGGFAAGILVILVAMNLDTIIARFGSATGPDRDWRSANAAGAMVIEQIDFAFDEEALSAALPANQPIIVTAMAQLANGQPDGAAAMLRSGDTTDPVVTYAQGVVAIAASATDTIEAQRLLRSAAASVSQAGIMLGELLFKTALVGADLPRSALRTIDLAGNPIPATVNQMLAEAVELWESALLLGSVKAQRLLDMAAARGLTGRADVVAAFTIWDGAAVRGDAVAQFECALLLLTGVPGVAADIDRAIDYLRMAAAQDFPPAVQGLAYALTKPMLEGDEDAGREAIAMLQKALSFRLGFSERAALEDLYGHYLMEVMPPALRYPEGAVDHWMRAIEYGRWESAISVAEAYQSGNGRAVDLVRAYAYYTVAAIDVRDDRIEEQRAALELRLTASDRRTALDLVEEIRGPGEVRLMMQDLQNRPVVGVGITPELGSFGEPSSLFGP